MSGHRVSVQQRENFANTQKQNNEKSSTQNKEKPHKFIVHFFIYCIEPNITKLYFALGQFTRIETHKSLQIWTYVTVFSNLAQKVFWMRCTSSPWLFLHRFYWIIISNSQKTSSIEFRESRENSRFSLLSSKSIYAFSIGEDFTHSLIVYGQQQQKKQRKNHLISTFEIMSASQTFYEAVESETVDVRTEWKFIVCWNWTRMNFGRNCLFLPRCLLPIFQPKHSTATKVEIHQKSRYDHL